MSDIGQELLARAVEIAERLDAQTGQFEKELHEIELRKRQIEAKLHLARSANKRLLDFRPTLGANYQCPDCWIKNEKRSAIRPVPGSKTHNLFRCPTCNVEFRFLVD